MKKKKVIFTLTSILILLVVIINISNDLNEDKVVLKDSIPTKRTTNSLSMLFETTGGSGVYEEVENTNWPSSGYKFNSTLSKCENGGELSWDDTNKQVIMAGTSSDKCYVYFDAPIPLSSYIKTKVYTGTQGENNIYYHKNLANSAEDSSYRYAGPYESVNNYVCFGSDESTCPHDNLYRIIGVFGDNVKLIKADYAKITELGTSGAYYGTYKSYEEYIDTVHGTNKGSNTREEIGGYYWNYNNGNSSNSNIWANSKLNAENLNVTYLNNYDNNWQAKIATTAWKVGGNNGENIQGSTPYTAYFNEIVNPASGQPAVTNKIGLMYVSDYGFAAEPNAWSRNMGLYVPQIDPNWMYMGLYEWTITRYSDSVNQRAFYIRRDGVVANSPCGAGFAVRPCFYLESSVTYNSGSGTYSDPYRIS